MKTSTTLTYVSGGRTDVSRLILGAGVFAMLGPGVMAWLAGANFLGRFYSGRWIPVLTALPMLFVYASVVVGTALLAAGTTLGGVYHFAGHAIAPMRGAGDIFLRNGRGGWA